MAHRNPSVNYLWWHAACVKGNMDILLQYAYCDVQYAYCRNFYAIWTLLLNPSYLEEKNPYCIYIHIAVQYGFFFLITDNNRQKPTYWACQVKHTSFQ